MIRRPQVVPDPTNALLTLPDDLAPALRERVDALLRQVPLAGRGRSGAPAVRRRAASVTVKVTVNRCVFCHRPGKLGGHHDEYTGDVVWTHAKCHRRHHRAHRRTARGDRWWQARVAVLQPTT